MSGMCIYCSSRVDRTKEHCLPKGLGSFKGHHILENRICNSCNKPISRAEEQFLRASPEALFRQILGIKGRKYHKAVSPFYRGSSGAPPIVINHPFPGTDQVLLWEVIPGTSNIIPLRQIGMSSGKEKVIPIPLPTKLDSKVKLIQHLRRYNLENAEPVYFYSPSEEWDNMINILQQIWPNIKESKLPLQKQDTRVIATTKVTVTSLYFRAVAKIGFHYFLYTFSHRFSGRESEFTHIRSFIKDGIGQPEEFVHQIEKQIVFDLARGFRTKTWGHFLTAATTNNTIISRIQFFVGPHNLPQVFKIRIGLNPSRIRYPEYYGHFYSYFLEGPKNGYDGEVIQLYFPRRTLLPR